MIVNHTKIAEEEGVSHPPHKVCVNKAICERFELKRILI